MNKNTPTNIYIYTWTCTNHSNNSIHNKTKQTLQTKMQPNIIMCKQQQQSKCKSSYKQTKETNTQSKQNSNKQTKHTSKQENARALTKRVG